MLFLIPVLQVVNQSIFLSIFYIIDSTIFCLHSLYWVVCCNSYPFSSTDRWFFFSPNFFQSFLSLAFCSLNIISLGVWVQLHFVVSVHIFLRYDVGLMITSLRKACTAVSASTGKARTYLAACGGKYCADCTSEGNLLWYCSLKSQNWSYIFDRGKCAGSSSKKPSCIWGEK